MPKLVHETPGRLRFVVPALRRQYAAADTLRRAAAEVPGLAGFEVNPLTGSLLITFDPARTRRDDILAAADAFLPGLAQSAIHVLGTEPAEVARPSLGEEFATALRKAIFERVAQVAIAALI